MNKFDKIYYKKNFLTKVIFRIDFFPILKLKDNLTSDFQDKIRTSFPGYSERIGTKRTFQLSADKQTSSAENFKSYHMNSKDDILIITFESISLEEKNYNCFEDFKDSVKKIYNYFKESYSPITISRVGLRYINEIVLKEGNPFDWDDLINPLLTQHLQFLGSSKNNLSREMSQIIINKDDYSLNFNFGLYNASGFPAKISRREFILDYDCYTTNCDGDDDPISFMDKFHLEIQSMYEKSIEDKLRKIMEVNNGK